MNQISILISLYFSIFENEHFTNNLTNLNRLHVYTPTHTQRMTHSRETKGKRFVHNRTLPSIIHTHTFSNFVFYIFVTELIPTWSTTTPRFNLLWFLRLLPSFFHRLSNELSTILLVFSAHHTRRFRQNWWCRAVVGNITKMF